MHNASSAYMHINIDCIYGVPANMRPMDMSSGMGYVHSAQFSIINGSSGSIKKPAREYCDHLALAYMCRRGNEIPKIQVV